MSTQQTETPQETAPPSPPPQPTGPPRHQGGQFNEGMTLLQEAFQQASDIGQHSLAGKIGAGVSHLGALIRESEQARGHIQGLLMQVDRLKAQDALRLNAVAMKPKKGKKR